MFKALIAAFYVAMIAFPALAQTSVEKAAYSRAVVAMNAGNWDGAKAAALSAGPIAGDIIEWHRLRSGKGTFSEVTSFLARRPDWPGLRLLRRRSERALPLGRNPKLVLAYFSDVPPQTGGGATVLITAYEALGMKAEARELALSTWKTMTLSSADEARLLKNYGNILTRHTETRLDAMLWLGARQNIDRLLPKVSNGHKKLAKARLALQKRAKGVDSLVAAVPSKLANNPGLAFDRMNWRARKGKSKDAIALMIAHSPNKLGIPEKWAGWRRSFARNDMRAGRVDRAYKLASQHGLTSGSHFADLEWLSGYLALTYDRDGDRALKHFLRFRGAVETPISLGRAGYWEGRAHELRGDTESARLAYAFGAEYQTSFYGQLAAEKIGRKLDPTLTGQEVFPDWKTQSFAENSVFKAARVFMSAGQTYHAHQFLRHLSESLNRDQIGSLGNFVLARGENHIAVMIGKQAVREGHVLPRAYFPTPQLGVHPLPVAPELALAIARRESEFNPTAQSGVGARGLMQLMPATAKEVAKGLGVPYRKSRLLSDPAYNALLGTAYLDELLSVFDGNVVMVAAGYNAGPSRPIGWMRKNGDPRRGEVDIIDWIEHIPFDETRNYVMRVAESLPVYRARLTGKTGPILLSKELVAMPGHQKTTRKSSLQRPRPRPDPLTD